MTTSGSTRRALLCAGGMALFLMCGVSSAADTTANPFIGTWHLDVAHSKVGTGADEIKSYDLTASDAGDGKVRSQTSWVMADGTKGTREWTASTDGKKTPIAGDPEVDAITVTSKDPHSIATRGYKGNKVVEWGRYTVSADGKTIHGTEGTGNGKSSKTLYHLVFIRQ